MSQVTLFLSSRPKTLNPGIDPTARIHPSAQIGQGVSIGAYSIIEAHAQLDDEVTIGAHTVIESGVCIGKKSEIGHEVVIHSVCQLGAHVLIH